MALTEQQKQQILGKLKGGRPTQQVGGISRFNARQLKQVSDDPDVKKITLINEAMRRFKDYRQAVERAEKFKFFKTGELDSKYGELKLAYKEAKNLGALTGPDIDVLEETIKPVTGKLGKFVKYKLSGGPEGVLAALDSIMGQSQGDKDSAAELISTKYGKTDPYIQVLIKDTKTAQPSPLEAAGIPVTPELQAYIKQRKQELGITPGEEQGEIAPPRDQRTGFERVLGAVTAPARFLTGKTGTAIGEAVGTGLSKEQFIASPEAQQLKQQNPEAYQQILETTFKGPGVGRVAGDIAMAGIEIGGAGIAGKFIKGGLKIAQPLLQKLSSSRRLKQTLDIIKPALSTAEKETAIASGRVKTSKGLFGKTYEIPPSNYDVEVAETVKGIVKKGWKPEKNIKAIKNSVSKIDAQIQEGLSIRNKSVNQGAVRNFLNKVRDSEASQFVIGGDKQAKAIYDSIINNFTNSVKKLDNKGLLEARKTFDKTAGAQIRNLFGEQFGSVRKQAVLDIRRGVNNFISKNLPEGKAAENLVFKEALQKEHRMLNAIENIAEQIAKKVGKPTFLQQVKRGATSPQAIGSAIGFGALGGLTGLFRGQGGGRGGGD